MTDVSINRPPVGFNELLQLQTRGQNPNKLGDNILATIDYENFIRNNIELRIKTETGTFDNGDINTWPVTITVPEGDLWVCTAMSFAETAATSPSAAEFVWSIGMQSTTGTPANDIFFAMEDFTGSPDNNSTVFHSFSPYFWVPSGNVFGAYLIQNTSAALRTGKLSVLHYRYKK